MRYYTVYKDDEIIAFGSSLECTEKLGLKNVRQMRTPPIKIVVDDH